VGVPRAEAGPVTVGLRKGAEDDLLTLDATDRSDDVALGRALDEYAVGENSRTRCTS